MFGRSNAFSEVILGIFEPFSLVLLVKRYPEPMAHGPEACEPSHPLWPMARRPVSRHTRAEAVDTGCQRDIPVLQPAKFGIRFLTIRLMWNYHNFTVLVDLRLQIREIPDFYRDF